MDTQKSIDNDNLVAIPMGMYVLLLPLLIIRDALKGDLDEIVWKIFGIIVLFCSSIYLLLIMLLLAFICFTLEYTYNKTVRVINTTFGLQY